MDANVETVRGGPLRFETILGSGKSETHVTIAPE